MAAWIGQFETRQEAVLAARAEAAEAECERLRAMLRDLDAMRRNFNAGCDRVGLPTSGQDAA